MPAISVLLPVRDAGAYLAPALASLWRQSFSDFEVVAVDDGSRDGSGARLERAAAREPRLRVLHMPAQGLPAALNLALATARAPLIARHDADDLSHRERLALQHGFLVAHPEVAVVGCRVRLFPAAAIRGGMRRWAAWHNALLAHERIAREALIDSPLAHGTALIRRDWLVRVGGWAERGWAEDLDLWLRLLEAGARLAKLPRVLYGWRQRGARRGRPVVAAAPGRASLAPRAAHDPPASPAGLWHPTRARTLACRARHSGSPGRHGLPVRGLVASLRVHTDFYRPDHVQLMPTSMTAFI